MPASLEELVQQLSKAFAASANRTGTKTQNKLMPPATKSEIEAFEREKGIEFPKLYWEFLTLHNGWINFRNDYILTGVSGKHTERAWRDFAKADKEFIKRWTSAGRSTDPAFLKKYQAKSPANAKTLEEAKLYFPSLLKLGTNCDGNYFAFNALRPDKKGEPEVLSLAFFTRINRRHANFRAFLEFTLAAYSVER
jgi:cell wall assembly regulator SMI1